VVENYAAGVNDADNLSTLVFFDLCRVPFRIPHCVEEFTDRILLAGIKFVTYLEIHLLSFLPMKN
jgi:hypothetical protein